MENDGKGGDGIGGKRMGMGRAEGRTKEGEGTAVACVVSHVIERACPKSGHVPNVLKGMSKERACPRRPSAPPGEMLQGTRSHLTCITSNRMIRVMVAMLTRWMISARGTSTDSDGRLFFVIFIPLRLYKCKMRQSRHGLASCIHDLRPMEANNEAPV